MSKRELIDAIRIHNRSVSPEFLATFTEQDLQAYLDRIFVVKKPEPPAKIGVTLLAKQPLAIILGKQSLAVG